MTITVIRLSRESASPACCGGLQLAARTVWVERVATSQRNTVRTAHNNTTHIIVSATSKNYLGTRFLVV